MRAMRAGVLSSAVDSLRTTSRPSVATLPAGTAAPGPRRSGADSPEMCCSDTLAVPHAITPSSGTASPGRTSTCCPGRTRAAGTSSAVAARGAPVAASTSTTVARLGTESNRRARLPVARSVSLSSKRWLTRNSSSSSAPSAAMPM